MGIRHVAQRRSISIRHLYSFLLRAWMVLPLPLSSPSYPSAQISAPKTSLRFLRLSYGPTGALYGLVGCVPGGGRRRRSVFSFSLGGFTWFLNLWFVPFVVGARHLLGLSRCRRGFAVRALVVLRRWLRRLCRWFRSSLCRWCHVWFRLSWGFGCGGSGSVGWSGCSCCWCWLVCWCGVIRCLSCADRAANILLTLYRHSAASGIGNDKMSFTS